MSAIADHALLSDCHSAALVTRSGSVDWLCFPRFDSPSVLGRLLDDDAGHWSIAPAAPFESSRRYVDRSMVLETTFVTSSGRLVLTDALAFGAVGREHQLGKGSPHLLIRRVECTAGEVDLEVEYAPRAEYGLVTPLLSNVEGGVTARGGAEWLVLTSPLALTVHEGTGHARLHLSAGQARTFALHRSTLDEVPARVWTPDELTERLQDTIAKWQAWSQFHQTYDGPWADLVWCSGRVLQALHYQPSGATRQVLSRSTSAAPSSTRPT